MKKEEKRNNNGFTSEYTVRDEDEAERQRRPSERGGREGRAEMRVRQREGRSEIRVKQREGQAEMR